MGVAPQDLKYHGERAETRIGHRNRIREFVTIHRGTEGGGLVTRIGDDNLIMAYAHIAHDANIGSHCILGNAVTMAGHVTIGDWAIVEAFTGVHQFCRIGQHAFVGGYSVLTQDVLPYSQTVTPRESKVFGENKVGLKRRGFSSESIERLHKAFRLLTQRRAQHLAGAGADPGRNAAVRGGGRADRVHPLGPTRVYQVRYGLIAGNGRFPILALETARALGHEVVVHGDPREGVAGGRDAGVRAATGSPSAELSRLIDILHSGEASAK